MPPIPVNGLKELVAECTGLEGHISRACLARAGHDQCRIRDGQPAGHPRKRDEPDGRVWAAPIAAFQLCAIGSVSDFKEVTRYRLLGTGGFEVSPTVNSRRGF